MIKKLIFTTTLFLLLFTGVTFANDIEVILDGDTMQFSVDPRVIDGSTMVPLRSIFEALGADVKWDQKTQTVTAKKADTTVVLTIGKKTAYVNNKSQELTTPGTVINGSTLVPLRFVSQALGAYVHWNGTDRIVSISSDGSQVTYQSNYVKINTATIEQLKRILHIDDERAALIVELRKTRPFASYEDLTRIKGIGEVRAKEIKAQGIIKF
ncbi:hypothetical protein DS745_13075 [Anaerobacillus alkaliphilus]|uniref:Copper amine oxidase-like N-terminal domain-containing protein n=1 Tax=Anaerobacillus alkaliphilus TaxID=1548597 RepID=A0A4Q0VRD8_9BACI|nr:stalk domain-containing protein [Anaerobacillus alkaliphilus]RXI99810.1 hypothetical protein DS745_13075 [Anaerobacillus alkaliphilus]